MKALVATLTVLSCSAAFASAAAAVTFGAAIPSGAALSRLGAADTALVALDPSPAARALVRARGGVPISPALGLWRLPGRKAAALVPELRRTGALRYAEVSKPRDSLVRFTDPLATPQLAYHLISVGADRAEPPGPGFPITVIDSGIDLTNPDFAGRPGTTTLNPQFVSGPEEEDYHGTAVASTAAAAQNGAGAEGVYPRATLRIYDRGDMTDAGVIAGIEAALAAGPSVINLSLGGPGTSRSLYEETLRAVSQGSLVVASSGNDLEEGNPVLYPGAFPHVLTVGATGRTDEPSLFSSSSPAVDVAAPGEEIPVQHPTDPELFTTFDGTSFSAPIVAAAAAWVRTVRGSMTVGQLADLIRVSARDVGPEGYDERTGFGILDIPAALAAPIPAVDPQEPNDDVRQVAGDAVFGKAKPLVSGRFSASLDDVEDPADVYRVSVPTGRRLTVAVVSNDDVSVALFGPTSVTVETSRGRIALSDRKGKSETATYVNRSGHTQVLFLDVTPGRARTISNPSYRVTLTSVRAPR